MARYNARLTTLDWISVFEIDHLIFTWRVYNNLADFEKLQITQLNNPKGCKLGKWMNSQTDSKLIHSQAFRQVMADHEEIHKYACASWNAKERGNREEAMRNFMLTYEAYQRFLQSLNAMREDIKSCGDTEITAIPRKK